MARPSSSYEGSPVILAMDGSVVLGIESTAHTASAGVVRRSPDGDFEVLSIRSSAWSPPKGGIHPREAANDHAERLPGLIRDALGEAGVDSRALSAVAFAQGPGRALSAVAGVPLVGVNHCVAHLEVGRALMGCDDPVLLYASGGNTQVIAYAAGRYRVFGETLDIGIGNMLDKYGRAAGLPFPSGPALERLARGGRRLLPLPYSVKGMDVAFSGMLTSALQMRADGAAAEDLALSLQEVAFAMLVEVAERAMAHVGRDELLLGGGVAANARLREMARLMAEGRGARAFVPEPRLCVDNGAMIAVLGAMMHAAGATTRLEDSAVRQRFRTDEVEVTWR
jgi:N6-L-threonylcarbamoyladenine synthase